MRRLLLAVTMLAACHGEFADPDVLTSSGTSTGTTASSTAATEILPATTDVSSTDSTRATTSALPPSYGPCDALHACPAPLVCSGPGTCCGACSARCETVADCGTPPPGQSVACLDLYEPVPGAECVLPCDVDAIGDQGSCPPGMVCGLTSGVKVCTWNLP